MREEIASKRMELQDLQQEYDLRRNEMMNEMARLKATREKLVVKGQMQVQPKTNTNLGTGYNNNTNNNERPHPFLFSPFGKTRSDSRLSY
jgi:hypothetical protein